MQLPETATSILTAHTAVCRPAAFCSCYNETCSEELSMEEGIKRWTAKRRTALIIEIIQGWATVAVGNRHSICKAEATP